MTSSRPLILYIHGFNSSPASAKAQEFSDYCQAHTDYTLVVPALSHDPKQALAQLESLVSEAEAGVHLLVGSSLGGYYATWLAEKYGCRAVLVNPAVSPAKTLGEEFLGPQKNLYTGAEYEFTLEYARFLDTLDINPVTSPENFLLLVQTGDEVLDYRLAVERYAGATQIVQEGGGHRFDGFAAMIPAMLEFADTGTLSPATLAAVSTIQPDEHSKSPERKTTHV